MRRGEVEVRATLFAVFHEYTCAMNGSAGAEAFSREEIISFAPFNFFLIFFLMVIAWERTVGCDGVNLGRC